MSTNETSTDILIYPEANFGQNVKSLFKRAPITQINSSHTTKDNDSKILFSPNSQRSTRDDNESNTIGSKKFDFKRRLREDISGYETDNLNDTGLIPRPMVVKPSEMPLLENVRSWR